MTQIVRANSDYYDQFADIESELYEFIDDSECVKKAKELVKGVSAKDIDDCRDADDLLSIANEFNEYIVNQAEKCHENGEDLNQCSDGSGFIGT